MLRLRIILLLCLVTGALTQDLFDLADALDDAKPTTPKPEQPKATEKPKDNGGFGFNLEDAVGPDPNPPKPTVKPPNRGEDGGPFSDLNLIDGLDGGGDGGGDGTNHKPDGGRPGGGGAADEPQDPDLLWGQILKMLNANMPEEFFMWMSNLKQILAPLLERAMDLLQAIP